MKSISIYTIRVLACLGLAATSYGAHAAAPAPLPPAAQEAVNKGIIAAKVPDYPLAIRYFEEARKLAPQAPVVYLNLGLAESKIPGRELRAMAWFGAYLDAHAEAPNAAAVREQIAVLEVRNRSNVSRLMRSVEEAAETISRLFPDGARPGCSGCSHPHLLVAGLWAHAGDVAAALKSTDRLRTPGDKGHAYRSIAKAQAKTGDLAGALKTADLIQDAGTKGAALRDIANARTNDRDFAGALRAASLIPGTDSAKVYAYREIALAQAGGGDFAGARQSAAFALASADSIPGASDQARSAAVEAQAKAGDIVGARKTADLIQTPSLLGQSLAHIAEGLAAAGDAAGAKLQFSAALRATGDDKYAQYVVARAQARSRDIAGAQAAASMIPDVYWRPLAQTSIAEIQARSGDPEGAQKTLASASRDSSSVKDKYVLYRMAAAQREIAVANFWLRILDDNDPYGYGSCPLNTGLFLDTAGYLKSLPASNDPEHVFRSLHETARKFLNAQADVEEMLKQQAKPRAQRTEKP